MKQLGQNMFSALGDGSSSGCLTFSQAPRVMFIPLSEADESGFQAGRHRDGCCQGAPGLIGSIPDSPFFLQPRCARFLESPVRPNWSRLVQRLRVLSESRQRSELLQAIDFKARFRFRNAAATVIRLLEWLGENLRPSSMFGKLSEAKCLHRYRYSSGLSPEYRFLGSMQIVPFVRAAFRKPRRAPLHSSWVSLARSTTNFGPSQRPLPSFLD